MEKASEMIIRIMSRAYQYRQTFVGIIKIFVEQAENVLLRILQQVDACVSNAHCNIERIMFVFICISFYCRICLSMP